MIRLDKMDRYNLKYSFKNIALYMNMKKIKCFRYKLTYATVNSENTTKFNFGFNFRMCSTHCQWNSAEGSISSHNSMFDPNIPGIDIDQQINFL